MKLYPVPGATLSSGGVLTVEVRPGKLYRCTTIHLRPRNKDPHAVLEDIEDRAKRGQSMTLGDMSWPAGEGEPYFFEYRERVKGQRRATPDPDRAVLRDHEIRTGIG